MQVTFHQSRLRSVPEENTLFVVSAMIAATITHWIVWFDIWGHVYFRVKDVSPYK
jgi:hypothetical protein